MSLLQYFFRRVSCKSSFLIVRFVSATTKSFQKKKKRPLITTRTPICHAKKGRDKFSFEWNEKENKSLFLFWVKKCIRVVVVFSFWGRFYVADTNRILRIPNAHFLFNLLCFERKKQLSFIILEIAYNVCHYIMKRKKN